MSGQAPDGTATNPFHLIESGVCKAANNETVMIQEGSYLETGTLNQPVTLQASGGDVEIGQCKAKSDGENEYESNGSHGRSP